MSVDNSSIATTLNNQTKLTWTQLKPDTAYPVDIILLNKAVVKKHDIYCSYITLCIEALATVDCRCGNAFIQGERIIYDMPNTTFLKAVGLCNWSTRKLLQQDSVLKCKLVKQSGKTLQIISPEVRPATQEQIEWALEQYQIETIKAKEIDEIIRINNEKKYADKEAPEKRQIRGPAVKPIIKRDAEEQ